MEELIGVLSTNIIQVIFVGFIIYIIYLSNSKKVENRNKKSHNKNSAPKLNRSQNLATHFDFEALLKQINEQKTPEQPKEGKNYETSMTVEGVPQEGINYESKAYKEKKPKKTTNKTKIAQQIENLDKNFNKNIDRNYTSLANNKPYDEKQPAENPYAKIFNNPDDLKKMFLISEIFKPKF